MSNTEKTISRTDQNVTYLIFLSIARDIDGRVSVPYLLLLKRDKKAYFCYSICRMLIIAHRGVAHRGADENSVEAFCRAAELNIDGVELDIRLTKDEEPVIVHDVDLRRVAGNNRKIEDLLWKEVREIKLRHGSSIPLLDDVTACIPAPMKIDFEVKDHTAVHLVIRKLSTSKGVGERSLILSLIHI